MKLFKRPIKRPTGRESSREIMEAVAAMQQDLIQRDEEIEERLRKLEKKEEKNGLR